MSPPCPYKSQEASKAMGSVQNFLSRCDRGSPKTGNRGHPVSPLRDTGPDSIYSTKLSSGVDR